MHAMPVLDFSQVGLYGVSCVASVVCRYGVHDVMMDACKVGTYTHKRALTGGPGGLIDETSHVPLLGTTLDEDGQGM